MMLHHSRRSSRMLTVKVPQTAVDLDQVRTLFRSFILWHRTRHHQDIALIDAYFDADAFEAELEGLPGPYAPPGGALCLATLDGAPAGCVALRPIDATRCEMKRMFVYPEYHGKGVGRALGEAVIACGAAAGYKSMLLDTSVRQGEAQALYTRLGFRQVAPYYELPDDLRKWLVFMERPLAA
jgi:putative acetyltransferase